MMSPLETASDKVATTADVQRVNVTPASSLTAGELSPTSSVLSSASYTPSLDYSTAASDTTTSSDTQSRDNSPLPSSVTRTEGRFAIVQLYRNSRREWMVRIAPQAASSKSPSYKNHHRRASSISTALTRSSSISSRSSNTVSASSPRSAQSSAAKVIRSPHLTRADSPYMSLPLLKVGQWNIAELLDAHYAGWEGSELLQRRITQEMFLENVAFKQYLPKNYGDAPPKQVCHCTVVRIDKPLPPTIKLWSRIRAAVSSTPAIA